MCLFKVLPFGAIWHRCLGDKKDMLGKIGVIYPYDMSTVL